LYAFLTILPSIILLGIFVYGFIGQTFYWSLTDWSGLEADPDKNYVGLDKYEQLFSGTGTQGIRFRQGMVNTFFFTGLFLAGCLIMGFLLAVLLDQNVKGEGIFRTIFLFPMALSFAVTGTIWRWLLNPKGGVNVLPEAFGGEALDYRWLSDRSKFTFNWHEVPITITLLIIFLFLFVFIQQLWRKRYLATIYVGVPMVIIFLWMMSDWVSWDDRVAEAETLQPGVTLISAEAIEVTEGGPPGSYLVALDSVPSQNVLVLLEPDDNLRVEPELLTFRIIDWNKPQKVNVWAVDDSELEGLHTGTVEGSTTSTDTDYDRSNIGGVTVSIRDNDDTSGQFSPADQLVTVTEGGAAATYTLALSSQPYLYDVVVDIVSDRQVITEQSSLTFTPLNWNVPQTVTLIAAEDDVIELPQEVTITHTARSDAPTYDGADIGTMRVQVLDSDGPTVLLTEPRQTLQVAEGGPEATYTLVMNQPPQEDVTVTITAGAQVTATPETVTFTPDNWDTPQTVTVSAVDDDVAEGLYTTVLTHAGDVPVPGALTVRVQDNDRLTLRRAEPGLRVQLEEGGPEASYALVMNQAPPAEVTVTLTAGEQVTATPETLTFTPDNWDTPQTLTLAAVDDDRDEGPHFGVIMFASPTENMVVPDLRVPILDNDRAAVVVDADDIALQEGESASYDVRLGKPPQAAIALQVTTDVANVTLDPATLTFTADNWHQPQTVTVSTTDDQQAAVDVTGTITHTVQAAPESDYSDLDAQTLSLTVADNDQAGVAVLRADDLRVAEGGEGRAYQLVLDTQPAADVRLILNAGEQVRVLPDTVVFTPENWAVPQGVTVVAFNDDAPEGTHTGTITTTSASADPFYGDALSIPDVTVAIGDNDMAGLVLSQPRLHLAEGGDPGSYTVALGSPPTSDLQLTLTPDDQLTVEPATLTFTVRDWDVTQTVTVQAPRDQVIEDETHTGTIVYQLSSDDPRYNALDLEPFMVYINDTDGPGVLVDSGLASLKEEDAGTRKETTDYTIELMSRPHADVTITLEADTDQVRVQPETLTFTPDNWDTPQAVQVTVINDNLIESEELYSTLITHRATSGDPAYDGITIPGAVIRLTDDDEHVSYGTFDWRRVPEFISGLLVIGFLLYIINLLWQGERRAAMSWSIPTILLIIWYVAGGPDWFPNVENPEQYGFNLALVGIILAAMWQMSGYTMAMYLAGIRGIPEELREAARVDGCSEWQVYTRIVLPMLRPITLSAAIVLGHISLKVFDLIFAMTGLDNFFVSVPGVQVYLTMFRSNEFAIGSAIAMVLLVMVALVVIPYLITSLRSEAEM